MPNPQNLAFQSFKMYLKKKQKHNVGSGYVQVVGIQANNHLP